MEIMIRIWFSLLALTFAAPLSAQQEPGNGFDSGTILALKNLQLLDQRMNSIGYKLVDANAPYCDQKTARTGLLLNDVAQYADQETASFALGFSGSVGITAVAGRQSRFTAGRYAAGDQYYGHRGHRGRPPRAGGRASPLSQSRRDQPDN